MNLKIELYKVQREIQMHGNEYQFYQLNKDKYGESTESAFYKATIRGLFHTSKGFISKITTDGNMTHTKGQTAILMCYEDSKQISNNDIVLIGENKYKVTEKNNIEMFDIVSDVSLELILDGNN